MNEICPHCGSKDVFTFKSDLYIVLDKDEFMKKPFFGCNACKSAFVIIEKTEPEKKNSSIIKTTNISNVQKTLGRLSKGCLGVLENIK